MKDNTPSKFERDYFQRTGYLHSATMRYFSLLGIVVTFGFFTGCTTVGIKVTKDTSRDRWHSNRKTLPASLVEADAACNAAQAKGISSGQRTQNLLKAARLALSPAVAGDKTAQALYASVVRQIVDDLQNSNWRAAPGLVLETKGKDILNPANCNELVAASRIHLKRLQQRSVQDGIGAAYAGYYKKKNPFLANQAGIAPAGIQQPLTAVLSFHGDSARLAFYDTLKKDHVTLSGKTVPLAADYSAPLALAVSKGRNFALDPRAMFLSNKQFKNLGLYQYQLYDPNKIPVILIHGLMARPEAWVQAVNTMMVNPEIRKHYQFWFYLYPTGLPVWASAAKLRQEMDRYHAFYKSRDPRGNLNRIVLIGHSMGGLITSILLREGGDKLWYQFAITPPEDLQLSPESKKIFLNVIYFNPRKDVSRAIFVSTPHRGSKLALRPIASFAAALIQLPLSPLMHEKGTILKALRQDARAIFSAPVNSIRFLRADSPALTSILKLPMTKKTPYHSIIGDRGRGQTAVVSSDGVVPYWSSHLDGTVSEKIVPSGHGANENPEGIREMQRILVENIPQPGS